MKSGELLSNLYRFLVTCTAKTEFQAAQEYVTPWTYKLSIQASLVFQIKPIHCQHMVSLLFSLSQVLKTISNDQSEVQPEAAVPSFMLLPFQGYQFPICCWYKLVRIVLPLSVRSSYQWSDLAMIFYDHCDHMNWSKAISVWAVQIIDLWKHIQLHSKLIDAGAVHACTTAEDWKEERIVSCRHSWLHCVSQSNTNPISNIFKV